MKRVGRLSRKTARSSMLSRWGGPEGETCSDAYTRSAEDEFERQTRRCSCRVLLHNSGQSCTYSHVLADPCRCFLLTEATYLNVPIGQTCAQPQKAELQIFQI